MKKNMKKFLLTNADANPLSYTSFTLTLDGESPEYEILRLRTLLTRSITPFRVFDRFLTLVLISSLSITIAVFKK